MTHKPSKADIKFAQDVFNKVVLTQVYNPFQLIEAAKRLFGEDMNWRQARQRIFTYFTYEFKGFDSTETCLPKNGELESIGTVENQDKQTHEEYLAENSETDNQEITDAQVMEVLKPKRGRKPNGKGNSKNNA